MPPSYGELPTPSETKDERDIEENDIKKLLTGKKSKKLDTSGNSEIESLILKEINK